MPWLSVGLAFLLAQAQPGPPLKIVILEGEGAINNIRQRTARETIVEVQDENNRPVAGAVLLFRLPERGASGTFANGSQTLSVTTDAQGRAVASMRPNGVQGQYQMRIDASHQGRTGTLNVSISNAMGAAAAAGGGSGKVIAILAVVGGAAAGGAVAATRRGGARTPAPPPTPTTISAGAPTVGPPR